MEETFNADLTSLARCQEELDRLIAELSAQAVRLKPGDRIDAVFVKIRFDDFRKTSVERRATAIHPEQLHHMLALGVARHARPVRLLGVGVRVVHDDYLLQMALFEGAPNWPQSLNGNPT